MEYKQTAASAWQETSQTVRASFTLTGMTPRSPWANGVKWRPEQLTITWQRRKITESEWSEWKFSAGLHGPKIRKDGTPRLANTVTGAIDINHGSLYPPWLEDVLSGSRASWDTHYPEDEELARLIESTRPTDFEPTAYPIFDPLSELHGSPAAGKGLNQ